jgi:hypothetical protein
MMPALPENSDSPLVGDSRPPSGSASLGRRTWSIEMAGDGKWTTENDHHAVHHIIAINRVTFRNGSIATSIILGPLVITRQSLKKV